MNDSTHDDIRQAFSATKNVALKEHELASGRSLLADYVHDHPAIAPWYIRMADIPAVGFSGVQISSFQTVGAALVLVLMLGSGTSYAAEGALPGDILYSIKKVINEGVREAIAVSPQAQVQWQTERASRRLAEAQTLAAHNNLTAEKVTVIEDDISDAAERISSVRADVAVAVALKADARIATIATATDTPSEVPEAKSNDDTRHTQDDQGQASEDSNLSVRVHALEALNTSDSNTTTRQAITSIVGRVRGHFRVRGKDDDAASSVLASDTATSSEGDAQDRARSRHEDDMRASKAPIRAGASVHLPRGDDQKSAGTLPALMSATTTITIPKIHLEIEDEGSGNKGHNE